MSIVAIVAEYNPFHKGHAYQLKKAKELTGADHALVIMSGNFVQRGAAAIFDKYIRTRMALSSGADCVLELPVWMATGPALDFATGAIRILNALGCVDYLCFGAESDDLTLLEQAASLFLEEPADYQALLKAKLSSASSYAKARQEAFEAYTGTNGDFLDKPNNILAISYLQALKQLDSKIKPVPVRRQGNYHDQIMASSSGYSSATAMRKHLQDHPSCLDETLLDAIPESAVVFYQDALANHLLVSDHAYWPMLKLRILEYLDHASDIYDFPNELSNRFEKVALQAASYEELIKLLSSPTFTNTRIHRGLLHMLLEMKQSQVDQWKVNDDSLYARVLGFRADHSAILKDMKENSQIPVLTKAMADKELATFPEYPLRKEAYQKDIFASNLYSMLQSDVSGIELQHEYRKKMIKL